MGRIGCKRKKAHGVFAAGNERRAVFPRERKNALAFECGFEGAGAKIVNVEIFFRSECHQKPVWRHFGLYSAHNVGEYLISDHRGAFPFCPESFQRTVESESKRFCAVSGKFESELCGERCHTLRGVIRYHAHLYAKRRHTFEPFGNTFLSGRVAVQ